MAGGCVACHTEDRKDAAIFAGGRALKTPFGTFYGPNLTPHPEAGIGRWTETDFVRAMRHGIRPDGAHYYPAFPYPSFTKIRDDDLADLWAYLRTLAPSARPNQAHDLRWPFRWRTLIAAWNWLFLTPGPMASDSRRPPAVDRGAYLVEALGHCGECHTPRNLLGAPKKDRALAGGKGPTGKDSPESDADAPRQVERCRAQGVLPVGHHPRLRLRRRSDGGGRAQHHQSAHARRSGRIDGLPPRTAAAAGGAAVPVGQVLRLPPRPATGTQNARCGTSANTAAPGLRSLRRHLADRLASDAGLRPARTPGIAAAP